MRDRNDASITPFHPSDSQEERADLGHPALGVWARPSAAPQSSVLQISQRGIQGLWG